MILSGDSLSTMDIVYLLNFIDYINLHNTQNYSKNCYIIL